MTSKFKDTDVVVFEGVISTWSIIKCLTNYNDLDVRKANQFEVIQFVNRPEKSLR